MVNYLNCRPVPPNFAAGLEHRREKSIDTPSATQSAGLAASYYKANPLEGDYDVTEVFSEINLPLLNDMTLAKSLELNAAWRTAQYSTAGRNHSWMTALDWKPFDSLKVRVSRAKWARAPEYHRNFSAGKPKPQLCL